MRIRMKSKMIVVLTICVVVFLWMLIYIVASRKCSGDIIIDYNNSYLNEFVIEENTVYIKCQVYIINNSNKAKSFNIYATSYEDEGTLLKTPDLYSVDSNDNEKTYRIKPKYKGYFTVIFAGEYGGINTKYDRNIPDNIWIMEL